MSTLDRTGSPLTRTYRRASEQNRAALVGYLPVGFPSVATSIELFGALADGGVDIVEVGIPYSDPVLDGRTIQAASEIALAQGLRMLDVLKAVEAVAARNLPPVVMSYWNPILKYGATRFARELAAAGGAGVITPDLTPEEAGEWVGELEVNGLDPIFLVAPSSSDERVRLVSRSSHGFIYAASTMGVTGARDTVEDAARDLVARTRNHTATPIAVGLGVSSEQQAAEIAQFADGVIVGSAFVQAARQGGHRSVAALAEELARGVRASG